MDASFDDLVLTKRQAAFVKEYVANDFNGTKAAIAAGFSDKGASVTACRLLAHPKIKAALSRIKGAVVTKIQEPQAIKSDLAHAVSTAQGIAITAENMMLNLARMGLTEHLRAKFLTVTEGHLRYDFSTATEEELAAISAQVDGVKFKCTTRIEPRKDQEPVEIRTVESSITWVDRKSTIELMGRYKEIMAWKDSSEKDTTIHVEITRNVVGQRNVERPRATPEVVGQIIESHRLAEQNE